MKGAAKLFSRASDHWFTPGVVLDRVERVGPIVLDPCSHPDAPSYRRAAIVASGNGHEGLDGLDGLGMPWRGLVGLTPDGLVFVNPPYSDIARWTARCARHALEGGELVLLVPARTDTRWWHACAPTARAVAFWRGRIRFERPGGLSAYPAPFPSALLYYGTRPERFAAAFADVAWIVRQGPFAF